jgi:multidrug efflux pump subunit AcrA (membrane-fusion protein)
MSEQDISLAPPDHSQELSSAEKEARAKELDAALSDLKEATSLANENVALRTQLAEATRKLEEARKDAERITTLEDAILIGTAMLHEIISADEAALTELSDMNLQVPEPVLTAKARHTVAQMTKAIEQGKGGDE